MEKRNGSMILKSLSLRLHNLVDPRVMRLIISAILIRITTR